MAHELEMIGSGVGGGAVMYLFNKALDVWKSKGSNGRNGNGNGNGTKKELSTLRLDMRDVMKSSEAHTDLLKQMIHLQTDANKILNRIATIQEVELQLHRDGDQP